MIPQKQDENSQQSDKTQTSPNFVASFNKTYKKFLRNKKKQTILITFCVILSIVVLFTNQFTSKIAIYVNGEKIGYAENTNTAKEILKEYNQITEENNVSKDIFLQNEVTFSQNLLNGDDIQSIINSEKNEVLCNAYALYIDGIQIGISDETTKLHNAISKTENIISELFGFSASIYNNIEIREVICSVDEIQNEEDIYLSICGNAEPTKENVTPSIILSATKTPVKLYSLNGIFFEMSDYYKVERVVTPETIYVDSDELYVGSYKLQVSGQYGVSIDTYKRTLFEGEVQTSELIDTICVTPKVDIVILRGTKKVEWDEKDKVLLFPIMSEDPRYTSEYGMRDLFDDGEWSMHKGLDVALPVGTQIIAADSGTVVVASENDSCGIYIEILHDNGLTTRYYHLSELHVKEGDVVLRGQDIALSGNTGFSTGPHLHFEVLDINYKHVNPRQYTKCP